MTAGADAAVGPPVCATVVAERPPAQVMQGAFTTVEVGGGAFSAAAAAWLAAEMPEALAKLAIEGIAEAGAASVVEFNEH